ncbi:MAG: hypothetical protein HOP00_05255 [Nitrospira sp.]|nr:hypothetical protein [Nitrospira sp.]
MPQVVPGLRAAAHNAVTDEFISANSGHITGDYLGDRMAINIKQRLLAVDIESFVRPFLQRPGAQEWVGEHAGKWLHAAVLAWEQTACPQLMSRLDHLARALISAQEPDGYLGTYLPEMRWTSWDVWSHKYNLIGLLAYHRITGDETVLTACRRMGDLLCATFGESKRDIISSGTHVGMAPTSVLEPMVLLYQVTGEQRYLDFSKYIVSSWDQANGPKLISSLLGHGDVQRTANGKAYEMTSDLVGLLALYRLVGESYYLRALSAAWRDIRAHQNYVTGTSSWGEHFQVQGELNPDGGMEGEKFVAAGEGCVTVTWIQFTGEMLRLTGDPMYAEELERSIYNALLAAQSPLDGRVTYFLPMRGRKRYGEVTHGILPDICCCASSIPRGIAMIPGFAVGAVGGAPAVLLYASGVYSLLACSDEETLAVTLQVQTKYPQDGLIGIDVRPSKVAAFSLLLRVPAWSTRFEARVGETRIVGTPGTFLRIERTWALTDRVEIEMELPFFTTPQGNPKTGLVAVQRGPQVLAVDSSVTDSTNLPVSWWGRQAYAVEVRVANQLRTLQMIPIAEAGQTKAEYEAVFPGLTLVGLEAAEHSLAYYRAELERCRQEHGGRYELPDIEFFLFGMGQRTKLLYREGVLLEAQTGRELRRWSVAKVLIVPPDYLVSLQTTDGSIVTLREDKEAVWLEEGGKRTALAGTQHSVNLPDFAGKRFPLVLRVLHQELLVNIVAAGPVPNLFVYPKPWYRDSAMVALALKQTGNVGLLREWILGLREPFDKNNAGECEPDNLGQVLFLVSLVSDKHHPVVTRVLAELPRFAVSDANGKYIKGRSDFAEHPVYQTKWLKYGLKALGLLDTFTVPAVADSYSALFWMDYKDDYVAGKDHDDRGSYAYLGWACDHFHGAKRSPLSNRDYPLTWEAKASQANYAAGKIVAPVFAEKKVAAPHTWHAAEAFLRLLEEPAVEPGISQ